MKWIQSYIGWTHILDIDPTAGSSDNNLFAGPRLQTPGKVSVQLPTDEWLCWKLAKLNLTLAHGMDIHPVVLRPVVYREISF